MRRKVREKSGKRLEASELSSLPALRVERNFLKSAGVGSSTVLLRPTARRIQLVLPGALMKSCLPYYPALGHTSRAVVSLTDE